jgi:hypothetical protein
LSRFYCNLWIPYDLDITDIIAGPEKLALAMNQLNAQGWNTSGKMYPVTPQRATMMMFSIQEKILEVSLRV